MNELANSILLSVNIHPCCKNAEGTDVHKLSSCPLLPCRVPQTILRTVITENLVSWAPEQDPQRSKQLSDLSMKVTASLLLL